MPRSSSKGVRKAGKKSPPKVASRARKSYRRPQGLSPRERATAEILRVISQSPHNEQPVFNVIAQSAARLCKAEYVAVYRYDGALIHFVAHHGLSPRALEEMGRVYPLKPGQATTVARSILTGAVAEIPDIRADPHYAAGLLASLAKARSIIAVPMTKSGRPIGSIAVARSKSGHFPARYIKLLETFADQAVIAIENARLFKEVEARTKELSEALDQQTATGAVLRVIAASPSDIRPVLDAVAESAARLCQAYDSVITLKVGDRASAQAHYGPMPRVNHEWPLDRGLVGARAIIDRCPVHVHDALEEANEFPLSYKVALDEGQRTLLAVPLLRDNEAIGALAVRRDHVEPFSQKQIDLLKTFADQAVIAIENVRLFEQVEARTAELTEALEQQTATADVLKAISRSTFDLQMVLNTLVESAGSLCGANVAQMFLVHGTKLSFAAGFALNPEYLKIQSTKKYPRNRGSLVGRVILDKQTTVILDAWTDPKYHYKDDAKVGNIRTILGVPLMQSGDVIGVITINRDHVEPFTEKQIALVTTFADQAVIAIQNARLFEQVQTRTSELTEALQQQTATADVLKVISRSTFDLKSVLHTLIESAAKLCDADMANITRQIDGVFVRTEFYGATPEFIEKIQGLPVVPDRGSAHGRALLEGKVIHIADVEADPEYTFEEARRLGGFRTTLGVPMMREGVPIGSMALARAEVRPFTDKQIELVSTFADQAAIAIENVRLFDAVQSRTRDLQQALEYQTATSEVLNVISRSPAQVQPVLDVIIETAVRLCEADFGTIARQQDDYFIRSGNYGSISAEFAELMKRAPVEITRGTITGRTLVEGKVIHVLDAKSDPEYTWTEALELEEIRTALGVPLLREGTSIGTIALNSP